MQEIWKDVVEYEGFYQVSNLGQVKGLERKSNKVGNTTRTIKEKILTPVISKEGYAYVSLCIKGIIKRKRIHRLVAQAFIPNPNNYPEVNHKDENRLNNDVSNLEWCSNYYNQNYGLHQERCRKSKEKSEFRYITGGYSGWYNCNS
jgi:hypothetical protein